MQSTSNSSAKPKRPVVSIVVSLLLIAASIWLFFNRQTVIDHFNVWQFHPSAAVESLATRSGMNANGIFLYNASQPSIENTTRFNTICGSSDKQANILGCYTNGKIYIYDVTNAQLDGIREVTAAHEMLHAAYERLDATEKARVDTLLEAEYARLKSDPAFSERMAYYAASEPGQRDNELHSIIGTEVPDISPELETYYTRYFSNRSQVTSLHAKYAAVFSSLQAQANDLSAQLTTLSTDIETKTATYNQQAKALSADIAAFNAKAGGGGFSSQQEFDDARAELVARVSESDTERNNINALVDKYQTLREQLQSIAAQSDVLNKSIDSTLAPTPSI